MYAYMSCHNLIKHQLNHAKMSHPTFHLQLHLFESLQATSIFLAFQIANLCELSVQLLEWAFVCLTPFHPTAMTYANQVEKWSMMLGNQVSNFLF